MRVAFYPHPERQWHNNLMLNLMTDAIERSGGTLVDPGSDHLDWAWLWSHRKEVEVIHLHWIVWHYMRNSLIRSVWALTKFVTKLVLIRLWGYRLVWTMHNVYPHERVYPVLDVVGRWAVAHLANAVIVHCDRGRVELRRRFLRKKNVYMAYMGHFIDVHPHDINPEEARRRLGIGGIEKVFLFFGALRPYKGLERLIRTFSELERFDAQLIIAGWALPGYARQLEALVSEDRRVSIIPVEISVEDAQIYLGAADVVVLPFTEILTSASVLTAMSFARPVIAPAMGCLPEIITEGSGILYDPDAEDGLKSALLEALGADLEAMGERACARVQQFGWDEVGREMMRAYSAR